MLASRGAADASNRLQVPEAPNPSAPGGAQAQPPMGVSPATGPTPNRGYEAAGLQQLGMIVKQMERMIPLVGATSEVGKTVIKCLGQLTKHVPAGSVTPAAEKSMAENTMMRATQANQQMQALRQGAGGAQQPGMGAAA